MSPLTPRMRAPLMEPYPECLETSAISSCLEENMAQALVTSAVIRKEMTREPCLCKSKRWKSKEMRARVGRWR